MTGSSGANDNLKTLVDHANIERKFSEFVYLSLKSVDEQTGKAIRKDIYELLVKYSPDNKIF